MALEDKSVLIKRAFLLEYFTISWNVLEGIVSIAAGIAAGSIALVGFGLDSFIEVTSGAVIIWRFRQHGLGEEIETAAERRAVLIVGVTFLLLAVYVLFESSRKLLLQEYPEESTLGIIVTAVSLAVMPGLAYLKHTTATRLDSGALMADAKETLACSYLSLTVLIGLAANAMLGWWWADPLAGLAIVYWLVREGLEAINETREGEDEE